MKNEQVIVEYRVINEKRRSSARLRELEDAEREPDIRAGSCRDCGGADEHERWCPSAPEHFR